MQSEETVVASYGPTKTAILTMLHHLQHLRLAELAHEHRRVSRVRHHRDAVAAGRLGRHRQLVLSDDLRAAWHAR